MTNHVTMKAENGEEYPKSIYHKTTVATGNQNFVATKWADCALPLHSTSGNAVRLYTGTENFEGYQYPGGHGKLKHYAHIQAIRTKSGLVIGDSSCWSQGWAKCTYPSCDARIDVTSLESYLRGSDETIYDIETVDDDPADATVTFDHGGVLHLDPYEWVEGPHGMGEPKVLADD